MWDSSQFEWDPTSLSARRSDSGERPRRLRREGCQVVGCTATLTTRFHK